MDNNFLLKKYDSGLSLNIINNSDDYIKNNSVKLYENYERSVNKNNRICLWNENIDCDKTDDVDNSNDVDGDNSNGNDYTQTSSLKDTYETLYQNIISYNSHTDMSDNRYFIRTYNLGSGKEIIVTTNMRNFGKIVSSISGDTGHDRVLIKTTTYVKNSHIDVAYTYGDNN